MPYVMNENAYEAKRVKMAEEVEQCREHLDMERCLLSQTLSEMVAYCLQHAATDPLIFPAKENPYKEKSTCTIL
jgi:hypothetical protein